MGEYDMTKQLTLAAVIAGAMTLPATAGGMSEPIMEPAIVVAPEPAGDLALLPIIVMGMLVAIASN
jgi:hypothetical protein